MRLFYVPVSRAIFFKKRGFWKKVKYLVQEEVRVSSSKQYVNFSTMLYVGLLRTTLTSTSVLHLLVLVLNMGCVSCC
jgi:hypothetical protein